MSQSATKFTARQLLFKEIFVGTLIYAVVLGLLNDYTSIVDARSFSTILLASFALEILTCGAFALKSKIIAILKPHKEVGYRVAMFFSVWFIMFVSKFVFIWAIDALFGEDITIHGFFGILVVVASVTIIHKLADKVFAKLGEA